MRKFRGYTLVPDKEKGLNNWNVSMYDKRGKFIDKFANMSEAMDRAYSLSIDVFINRQASKAILGVHKSLFSRTPGESVMGWYARNNGNLNTAKEIIKDNMLCLKKIAKHYKNRLI